MANIYLSLAILMVCCWPAWVSSCSALIAACLKAGLTFSWPSLFSSQEKSGVDANLSAAVSICWSSFARGSFSSKCLGLLVVTTAQTSSASSSSASAAVLSRPTTARSYRSSRPGKIVGSAVGQSPEEAGDQRFVVRQQLKVLALEEVRELF